MACFMLFIVGFVLYATTLLLPQLAQSLMGYTAELAGLMIMPGGFALILTLPLVGYLLSRYDARVMIVEGLLMLAMSMFLMAHRFDLDVDFNTLMWARVYQSVSLAFLFIPINTAAYSYLPREKNNVASGLINLFRNIGASVGISFVTTMLARRAQFHQSVLAAHANAYSLAIHRSHSRRKPALHVRGCRRCAAAKLRPVVRLDPPAIQHDCLPGQFLDVGDLRSGGHSLRVPDEAASEGNRSRRALANQCRGVIWSQGAT